MDPASLASFALVLTVAAASPGPAVVAVVARTLAGGRAGSAAFIAGLAAGDVLWLGAACLGLAALARAMGDLFVLVRLAGAAYLLVMAFRLWTATPAAVQLDGATARRSPFGLFGAGLALTLGNPKTMAFYLALLPAFMDLEHLGLDGFAAMSLVIVAVLAAVFTAYVHVADRARRLLAGRRAVAWINRVCGAALAGAAVAVATK